MSEPRSMEAILVADRLKVGYRVDGTSRVALDDVSFEIRPQERVMLIGASGCGKSTLLKTIAGFITPMSGEVRVRGVSSPGPGPDRGVVFQELDQLFPWKTAIDNIRYAVRAVGRSKAAATETTERYLDLMGLSTAAGLYPHQLSGGMKQRVAIARALAIEPAILLMDEPFAALDALTRQRLQAELRRVMDQTKSTLLFVTHSIDEALRLGDRIIVLGDSPSHVQEIVDVSTRDLDGPGFETAERHLRELLTS